MPTLEMGRRTLIGGVLRSSRDSPEGITFRFTGALRGGPTAHAVLGFDAKVSYD